MRKALVGRFSILCAALALAPLTLPAAAQTTLGAFTFDDALFGNTLVESDGGAFSALNWLNVVNVDPGNPGYLTGLGFDTGVANIGLGGSPDYTIGYSTAILNAAGDDLGIVAGRYSADTFTLSVSADGLAFSGPLAFGPAVGVATGDTRSYYYGGGGPYPADLYVYPIDLSAFGIAPGGSIVAVKVSGTPQADLIRVAGFHAATPVVPEPGAATMLVGAGAVAGLGFLRRGARGRR